MRKAIVTGCDGFIGQALAHALKTRGVDVIGIDRKSGREVKDIARHMPDDLDAVFHLAAQTSVFNTDLAQILEDNISAFMDVVDACAKHPDKPKLVYASSSTAYPPNTTSLYGISKRFDEEYAKIYLPSATGARLHNVYGPNPRQGTLLWCLLNKDNVTIYNQGKNVRHFTYIDDIVDGLIHAAGCREQLINIANPQNMSVVDFCLETGKAVARAGVKRRTVITCVPDVRDLDRDAQSIDPGIPLAPLDYTPVADGLLMSIN